MAKMKLLFLCHYSVFSFVCFTVPLIFPKWPSELSQSWLCVYSCLIASLVGVTKAGVFYANFLVMYFMLCSFMKL